MHDVRSNLEEYELPRTIEARRLRVGDRQEPSSATTSSAACGTAGEEGHVAPPPGAYPPPGYRQLTATEQETLTRADCTAESWSRIYVREGFDPASCRNVAFAGTCCLDRMTRLEDCTIIEADVAAEARIDCGSTLNGAVVGERARISQSSVTGGRNARFGNTLDIPCGDETGGRVLPVFAECSFADVAPLCAEGVSEESRRDWAQRVIAYRGAVHANRAYIGPDAVLTHGAVIAQSFIGAAARVEGPARVTDSTVLSDSEQPVFIGRHTTVAHSLLQRGSSARDGASVTSSLLAEASEVETHAAVSESVIGPNASVAKGEVTASVLGPFVAAHHQSLVIACIWPEGKGNIGYGAAVGSNHTSRLPDQGARPGEGNFFGLSCLVKFPSNLSEAPYSIIGPGVRLAPQRLSLPLSLILPRDAGGAGTGSGTEFPRDGRNSVERSQQGAGLCRIIPGWVFSANAFALLRNERKYGRRNKARHTPVDTHVFGPRLRNACARALELLQSPRRVRPCYLGDKDLPGLGPNILMESDRVRAISVYREVIDYIDLREALSRGILPELVRSRDDAGSSDRFESPENADRLAMRPSDSLDVDRCRQLLGKLRRNVRRPRERDYRKGQTVFSDYGETHPHPDEDEDLAAVLGQIDSELQKLARLSENEEGRSHNHPL